MRLFYYLPPKTIPSRERGVVIIEVMVAALIFALGILGLVGLQARLTQALTEDVYLTRAQQIIKDYVNQMAQVAPANRATDFVSGGANYVALTTKLAVVGTGIPTASAPVVTITNVATDAPAATAGDQCTDVKISIKFTTPGTGSDRCAWLGTRILPARGTCSAAQASSYTTPPGAAC